MKQNLENQQIQCDFFEKERDQEKQHRLKLEDEYMSHQQNHEEEVKLRLKFEGKFNNMHTEHRELKINHDRKLLELLAAQKLVKEHEEVVAEQSKELIMLREQNVKYEAIIADLKEHKLMADRDIRNKNNTLLSAEQSRLEAVDSFQLQRYEMQESVKDLNDIRSKMNMQDEKIKDLVGSLEAAKLERNVFESEAEKLRKVNEEVTAQFEERHGKIEELSTELEAIKCRELIYKDELDQLRKKLETTKKQLSQISEQNAETKAKDLTLDRENKKLVKDLADTQE